MTCPPIVKVGLALLKDGRLLLARNRGAEPFQIPGGKVEPDDADDPSALAREIKEELGVVLDQASLASLGCFAAPAAGKPGRVVEIRLYRGEILGEPAPRGEVDTLAWLDLGTPGDLPVTDVVRTQIIPFLRAEQVREMG